MGDVMGDINARRGGSPVRISERRSDNKCQCAAFHDVRLCDGPAQQDAGRANYNMEPVTLLGCPSRSRKNLSVTGAEPRTDKGHPQVKSITDY